MKIAKWICLAAIANVIGCSVEETVNPAPVSFFQKCKLPFVGDLNAEPEIEIVTLAPGGKFVPVTEGGSVSILLPPNAGRTVFASARVRNMHPCGVKLTGELKDPVSGSFQLDSRLINMELTDDGWASSTPDDIGTVSSIFACPNNWSERDLFDNEYELTMTVTDRDGRKATKSVTVIPVCNEPGQDAGCKCQCSKDYVLGQACSTLGDAGP